VTRSWIDITRPIDVSIPVFPGDPRPYIVTWRGRSGVEMTRLRMLSHTGTHLDLPSHVFPGVPRPQESMIREALTGRAVVAHIRRSGSPAIGLSTLRRALSGLRPPRRLLLRTNPQDGRYRGLSIEAAHWLAGRILLFGTDALSCDPPGGGLDVHRILLGAGTLIMENLTLERTRPGPYHLVALPLRLAADDGAPVRALIRSMGTVPPGGST
jgi:arylformamidase